MGLFGPSADQIRRWARNDARELVECALKKATDHADQVASKPVGVDALVEELRTENQRLRVENAQLREQIIPKGMVRSLIDCMSFSPAVKGYFIDCRELDRADRKIREWLDLHLQVRRAGK